MPRWVKRTLWLGVFGVCAGAGAFVAAHTNPFPPGVEDPGARPTTPVPTSQAPVDQRWNFGMTTTSYHQFHVGGRCRSAWETTGVVTIHADGTALGRATSRLIKAQPECDFPVAQIQTRTLGLAIAGERAGQLLILHLTEVSHVPSGSQDLGGFAGTLRLIVPTVKLRGGTAHASAVAKRPDGDLGFFASESGYHLTCTAGC